MAHFPGSSQKFETCGQFWAEVRWSQFGEPCRRRGSLIVPEKSTDRCYQIAIHVSFRYERTSAGIQRQLPRLDEVMLAQHENF